VKKRSRLNNQWSKPNKKRLQNSCRYLLGKGYKGKSQMKKTTQQSKVE
jgi:hypothetical protein